jgi:peptidoglycan/LPS O-acetylase OafA/YrhL
MMDETTLSPSARDSRLDLLRGAAMLYIVGFWHLDDYTSAFSFNNSVGELLSVGALGIFVFLSGMLLGRRYSIARVADVGRFCRRRMIRIYPMYVLASLGFMAAGLMTKWQMLKGAFGLNMLTGTAPNTLWFVEMLCLFYLLTPLFLSAYSARKTLVMGVALSLVFAAICHVSRGTVDVRLAHYILIFAIGIMAGRSEHTDRVLTGGPTIACSVYALAILWWQRRQAGGNPALDQMTALAFLPPVFWTAGRVVRWVNPVIVAHIAYASFATYLVHRLTGKLARSVYVPTSFWPALLYLYCLWLPVTYGLGWAIQRAYDRLCEAIEARLRRK